MPANPPILYPTASTTLPSRPYILSLTPHLTSTSSHLLLTHPSPEISIVDSQTLQLVDVLKGGHTNDVTCVATSTSVSTDEVAQGGFANEGNIWSCGRDARAVRWDERSRRPGQTVKANVFGKPHPVLSLALHEPSNLLVLGTEITSSSSHLLFYDTRSPSQPLYTHSTTHSDDITSLTFLPPTTTYAPPMPSSSDSSNPTPSPLLLSASTDGLLALTNPKEADEEEAFYGAESLDGSVAKAGWYRTDAVRDMEDKKGKRRRRGVKVWGRSDMDSLGSWEMGRGETGDVQMQNPLLHPTTTFKHLTLSTTPTSNSTSSRTHIIFQGALETAEEESTRKHSGRVQVDYLVDLVDSLGVGREGEGMVAVGSNEGDIVLMHHQAAKRSTNASGDEVQGSGKYEPSAFLLTPPEGRGNGHRDVVRCLWHDVRSQVLYSGSEDGTLCGFSLPPPNELIIGNPAHDDDGGDGREDINSDDEGDEMDVDDDEEDEEESEEEEVLMGRRGKRVASEVWGGGGEGGKRRRA